MSNPQPKWYSSVTRYQWIVLIVASLGWMFDAFEGQLFNITRGDMLPELIDLDSLLPERAFKERADVCAVPAAAVVGEAMVAIVLPCRLRAASREPRERDVAHVEGGGGGERCGRFQKIAASRG